MLMSMLFVALATFEYAILLAIRYEKQINKTKGETTRDNRKGGEKCHKIDRLALRAFIAIYVIVVVAYFCNWYSQY